jgi:hypothetical protein
LGVFLSTTNSPLKTNEKLFISWVGPRGIVAAGIASLFGTKLVLLGEPGAEYITPLVFSVVLVTVLLNATTARLFAKIVGVFLKTPEGVLIVGASKFSRLIASYLQKNDRHVVLLDTNIFNINTAKELGLEAINADIYSVELTDNIELNDVGYLLAMTGSDEINTKAISRFGKEFGETGTYRLMTSQELQTNEAPSSKELFSETHDYSKFTHVANKYPSIQEIPLDSHDELIRLLKIIEKDEDAISLFLKHPEGFLDIVSVRTRIEVEKGSHLVYIGKPMDLESILKTRKSTNELNEKE